MSTTVEAVQTTIPISITASASDVRSTLEALTAIGAGNVGVTGSNGSYVVTFTGTLGSHLMTGATDSLRSNGTHATITLDGGDGSDTFDVNLIAGRTAPTPHTLDPAPAPPPHHTPPHPAPHPPPPYP